MKYKEIILVILLVFLVQSFFSCTEKRNKDNISTINPNQIIQIDPYDFNKKSFVKASQFFKDIKYIPLETNNDNIIGNIDKILFNDSLIYIMDKITKSIFIFDNQGKFISKWNFVGRGPGEYQTLGDMCINQKNHLLTIYDNSSHKFINYDLKGNFINEDKTPFLFKFTYLNDSVKSFYSNYYSPLLSNKREIGYRLFTYKERVENEYLPYLKKNNLFYSYMIQLNQNFFSYQNVHEFIEPLNDTIYQINVKEGLTPRYVVDFGKYKVPFDLRLGKIQRIPNLHKKVLENRYCSIFGALESDQYLFICYSQGNLINGFFYDKVTRNSVNIKAYYIDDYNHIQATFPSFVDGNVYIGILDASKFKMTVQSSAKSTNKAWKISKYITKINKAVSEFDNPILIKMIPK